MKNKHINVSEFYKLISFTPSRTISTGCLGQWLRLKTDQEFTVTKTELIKEAIQNFETMQKNYNDFKLKWAFDLSEYKDHMQNSEAELVDKKIILYTHSK
jgi:hypothetical protein